MKAAPTLGHVLLRGLDGGLRSLLASSSPTVVSALGQIPGFAEARSAALRYQELETEARSRPSTQQAVESAAREVLGTLQSTGVAASDVLDVARAAAVNELTDRLFVEVADRVRMLLIDDLTTAVVLEPDRARAWLHDELKATVDAARDHGVAELLTPRDAIDEGRTSDFQAVVQAANRFIEVRRAQHLLEIALQGIEAWKRPGTVVAATMRGAADAWRDYGEWSRTTDDDGPTMQAPFPDVFAVGSEEWAIEWLRYFASTPTVTAWVPSARQQEEEGALLRAAHRAAVDDRQDRLREPLPGAAPTAPARVTQQPSQTAHSLTVSPVQHL